MNQSFRVTCLTADADIDVVYEGKWLSEAEQAAQDALADGAFYAEIETLDGDVVTSTREVERVP